MISPPPCHAEQRVVRHGSLANRTCSGPPGVRAPAEPLSSHDCRGMATSATWSEPTAPTRRQPDPFWDGFTTHHDGPATPVPLVVRPVRCLRNPGPISPMGSHPSPSNLVPLHFSTGMVQHGWFYHLRLSLCVLHGAAHPFGRGSDGSGWRRGRTPAVAGHSRLAAASGPGSRWYRPYTA